MRNKSETTGTQSATRALVLLRHIGARSPDGLRLTDLIALTGMDKSTIHRLLACLMQEGFVEHVPGSKSYRLGMESTQLGLVSADMAPLLNRFRPLMLKISRLSQDSVFLVARSGHHALCVHRENGANAQLPYSVLPGMRRIIGLSAAGVGILAQAPDIELEATYRQHASQYEGVGASYSILCRLIETARERGYSEMTSFGPMGTSGVGCVVPISDTTRIGISIAGVNPRMTPDRRRELGLLLSYELKEQLSSAAIARNMHTASNIKGS